VTSVGNPVPAFQSAASVDLVIILPMAGDTGLTGRHWILAAVRHRHLYPPSHAYFRTRWDHQRLLMVNHWDYQEIPVRLQDELSSMRRWSSKAKRRAYCILTVAKPGVFTSHAYIWPDGSRTRRLYGSKDNSLISGGQRARQSSAGHDVDAIVWEEQQRHLQFFRQPHAFVEQWLDYPPTAALVPVNPGWRRSNRTRPRRIS